MIFKKNNSYNWGEKKCQVILRFLGTPHYQALGQRVNSNVEQIFRTFNICNSHKKLIDKLIEKLCWNGEGSMYYYYQNTFNRFFSWNTFINPMCLFLKPFSHVVMHDDHICLYGILMPPKSLCFWTLLGEELSQVSYVWMDTWTHVSHVNSEAKFPKLKK
jgi:hypothetical protein